MCHIVVSMILKYVQKSCAKSSFRCKIQEMIQIHCHQPSLNHHKGYQNPTHTHHLVSTIVWSTVTWQPRLPHWQWPKHLWFQPLDFEMIWHGIMISVIFVRRERKLICSPIASWIPQLSLKIQICIHSKFSWANSMFRAPVRQHEQKYAMVWETHRSQKLGHSMWWANHQ